jgi:hypothetical protein
VRGGSVRCHWGFIGSEAEVPMADDDLSASRARPTPRERLFSRWRRRSQRSRAAGRRAAQRHTGGQCAPDVAASLAPVDHGGVARARLGDCPRNWPSSDRRWAREGRRALVAAFELGRRADHPDEAIVIRSADDVVRVARRRARWPAARARTSSSSATRPTGSRHTAVVSDGSIDRAIGPRPRDPQRSATPRRPKAFAVAHNHPSGSVEPSSSDVRDSDRPRTRCR